MEKNNTTISIDKSITSARKVGLIIILTIAGLIAFWFIAGKMTKDYPYHI